MRSTAHTRSRTTTEILDREELFRHLEARDPDALAALYDAKLNDARAKKLALARAAEDGEVLPGTDTPKEGDPRRQARVAVARRRVCGARSRTVAQHRVWRDANAGPRKGVV